MSHSITSKTVLVGLLAGLGGGVYGCSSGDNTPTPTFPGNTAGTTTTGTGGSAGSGVIPTAGTVSTGGTVTTTGGSEGTAGSAVGGSVTTAGTSTGGSAGASGAGTSGSAGASGSAGTGTGGGTAVGGEITKVVKSMGCGKPFAGTSGAKVTIQTMGTKDANCADKLNGVPKCGAWSTPRDYYINMPANYDMNRAYPLIIEGPGCGGNGTNIYPLPNIANDSIRIGITPGPNSLGHGTNENQGCFDDKEGDDSIDWVFYEDFYDALNQTVCFDRNRLFSAGNSSGSWFSNELGCKFTGDAMRPVRGVLPNTGGLPTEPQFVPTCTNKPMAGMWVHEINDGTNPFAGNKVAIDRALKVNGCTGATSYDAKVAANEIQDFPIGGGKPDNTCKLLKGCPEIYPLVVCALPGNQHGGHDDVVNPGYPVFLKQFNQGNFITQ